ncbi:MAG TPA: type II secretion system inner membrane protein GspF [Candidatus Omnitrophota bacterium]|nr:type II secretion system inner membrane protein GspF [Candidatus Omnitrophota bacterium]
MPVFEYSALDAKGRKMQGLVDAGSVVAARQKLRESEIFPVDLKEAADGKKGRSDAVKSPGILPRKARLRDIALMTRQLATLLGAGLPLVPSLSTLVAQTGHPELKKTLARIKDDVNEGNSLTQALSHFPRIFPPFYINMVRAGEASGTMHLVLERLADFSESQQALQTKIRSAMAYPLFMFLIGSAVLFFLVAFIVPNITKIFSEMHQTLPGVTVFLIVVSRFLQSFWWLVVGLVIAVVIVLRVAIAKTVQGQYFWDTVKIKAPLFGPVTEKIAMARFSRTLGTLLQSGVPLLTALEIVKNVVNNRLIADEVGRAAKAVEEGQSLSTTLAVSGLFPPITIEMISVGEQSGNMEAMLYKIADAYEKESEASVMMMTSMLEPVMILVMGLIVGFIVVSVLLPIFEMNQLVR